MYSQADPIVRAEDVRKFAQFMRDNDHSIVEEHDFVDSEHVQHFREYPQEYSKKILDFLEKTISSK